MVAIFSLLIAILLPAQSAARRSSQKTACQSKQRCLPLHEPRATAVITKKLVGYTTQFCPNIRTPKRRGRQRENLAIFIDRGFAKLNAKSKHSASWETTCEES